MDSTWSRFHPGDASQQANTIFMMFFPKSALFTLQDIEEDSSFIPTMPDHMFQQESRRIWKITP
jgi:hypothetical protein